jgi:hypothetical protein
MMENFMPKIERSFIANEIHIKGTNFENELTPKLLSLLHILLSEYEDEKDTKKKSVRKNIYLLTKKFYLQCKKSQKNFNQ